MVKRLLCEEFDLVVSINESIELRIGLVAFHGSGYRERNKERDASSADTEYRCFVRPLRKLAMHC